MISIPCALLKGTLEELIPVKDAFHLEFLSGCITALFASQFGGRKHLFAKVQRQSTTVPLILRGFFSLFFLFLFLLAILTLCIICADFFVFEKEFFLLGLVIQFYLSSDITLGN